MAHSVAAAIAGRFCKSWGKDGRLIALDRDAQAIEAAQAISDPRFTAVRSPFSQMAMILRDLGISKVAGVLLDIGVSSPQINEAERGFSFKNDGPLICVWIKVAGRLPQSF